MSDALNDNKFDYVIVGGGIVGVSTALRLQQLRPDSKLILLEKESALAQHQTGHNSGVIHAGVYYQPGSLKADFCKRGAAATMEFCRRHDIPFQQPGKLLVACNPLELERMHALRQRCQQNGISITELSQTQLLEHEPNVRGLGALLVPDSGIVDYAQITKKMAELFLQRGGQLQLDTELCSAAERSDGIYLSTNQGELRANFLISCSGLMADRVTRMLKLDTRFAIIPFRGEYYQLAPSKLTLVKHLIYPIPDPALPFLGVHLTPMINGSISVGPNAVLGWKRQGYGRLNFSFKDTLDLLSYPGFWHLSRRQLRSGLIELRNSLSKRHYLSSVQKYCPDLSLNDLIPYPTGIRAQAVLADGTLVQDFLFAQSRRSLHVCNAPSPAATSAIPIGDYICQQVLQRELI